MIPQLREPRRVSSQTRGGSALLQRTGDAPTIPTIGRSLAHGPANVPWLSRAAAPPPSRATQRVARNRGAEAPGQRTPLRRLLPRVSRRPESVLKCEGDLTSETVVEQGTC